MKPEMTLPAGPVENRLRMRQTATGKARMRIAVPAVAMAAALLLGAGTLPASAQTEAPREDAAKTPHEGKPHHAMARLTVTAEGQSSAQPDLATISLGVSVQAETAAAAMSENATRQQAVIDKLKAEGIEPRDIQTSGLSLSPVQNYSQDGKPPVITGYMAQNMVTLRVRDLSRLGPVLDMLVEAGANEINGISFTREDTTEAEDAARTNAVAAARHKAEVMAEAAGMKLGRLIALSDGNSSAGPRPMMMAMAADAKGSATPIEAGELGVSAQVSATFALIAPEAPAE